MAHTCQGGPGFRPLLLAAQHTLVCLENMQLDEGVFGEICCFESGEHGREGLPHGGGGRRSVHSQACRRPLPPLPQ